MSAPKKEYINSMYEQWRNYKYYNLESHLVLDYNAIKKEKDFDLKHLLFSLKKEDLKNRSINYQEFLRIALSKYGLTKIDDVQCFLELVNSIAMGHFYSEFAKSLFQYLSNGNAEGIIVGNTFYCREYNYNDGK